MTETVIKNRSSLEVLIMFLIINISIIFLTISTGVAEAIELKIEPKDSKTCDDICLTPGCIKTASNILEKIDENVDPCEDFFAFSCNQYIKNTNIPDDKSSVNIFSVVGDKLKEQLKTIITSPINVNDIEPFKNIKKLFQACMNKTLIEERGLKPLTDIQEKLGGWPVIKGDEWNESKWSWQQSIKDFNKRGYSTDYIFDFSVELDLKNTTKRIISIDQPILGLNREYLTEGLKNKIVQAYHSYQVDSAVLYGADQKRAENQMKEVIEFEIALANISLPKEERRDYNALYNAMTVKDLQAKYPYNDWLEYFNELLPNVSQVCRRMRQIHYYSL